MQKTRLIFGIAGIAGLAACGGGGGGNGGSAQGPGNFIATVQSVAASSSDTTEPIAIDTIAVVENDDAEPVPVS